MPLAIAAGAAVRHRAGARLAARAPWRTCAARSAGPLAVVATTVVLLLAFTNAAESIPSLIMFTLVAFVLVGGGAGVRARGVARGGSMSRESWPIAVRSAGRPQPAPLRRLHRARGVRDPVARSRRLVGVPDQKDARLAARPVGPGRRLQDHLREADRRACSTTSPGPARRSRSAPSSACTRAARPGTCTRAATTTRRATAAKAPSRACSTASRRARSTSSGAPPRTSGWRSQPDLRNINAAVAEADRQVLEGHRSTSRG